MYALGLSVGGQSGGGAGPGVVRAQQLFTATAAQTDFTLSTPLLANAEDETIVTRNGMRIVRVSASPANQDEYSVPGATIVRLGAGVLVGEKIYVDYPVS